MKIFTVVGARSQFMKAIVNFQALAKHCPDVREILIHIEQHCDANMSDVLFEELDISHPAHTLGVGVELVMKTPAICS